MTACLAASALGCARPASLDPIDVRQTAENNWGWAALQTTSGDAKHGEYLATIGACKECHTVRTASGALDTTKLFAGGIPFVGVWGTVLTANVSRVAALMPPDQLEDMIRGRLSYKFQMPTELYNQMAGDDMRDLLAYLRTLTPLSRETKSTSYAANFQPPPPNLLLPIAEHAPAGISVERGQYLTTIAICKDCHSPRTADDTQFDERHLFSGGGFAFRRADGRVTIPPNLTSDLETGIGSWTDAEVIRAIRTGVAQDGHQLSPMMPYSVALNVLADDDVRSIVMYLRSLPHVRRQLPENPRWSPKEPPDACCFPVPRADLDALDASRRLTHAETQK